MLITTYMYPTQNIVCMYVHHVLLCIKDLHMAVFCHTYVNWWLMMYSFG